MTQEIRPQEAAMARADQPDRETEPGRTAQPVLRVVKGSPSDEEVAALLAVLAVRRSSSPEPPETGPGSGWSAYRRSVRRPLQPGPGAWVMSGRD